MIQGLEVVIPQEGGFSRVVNGPKWALASIGYSEKYDEKNFTVLARHLHTDEAFILLDGTATLVIGKELKRIELRPLVYYTVKAGTWHHVLVTPGTRVAVVENSDTSKDNTETLSLIGPAPTGSRL